MIFRSSPSASPDRRGTRCEARGAVEPGPMRVPFCSPRSTPPGFYARDARAVPSGQLGVGEGSSAASRPELAPVLVVCKRCREPIIHNEILRLSFCPIHEFSQPFSFIPLAQRRLPGL